MARLRDLELKKPPSIAESVDWARTLIALEIRDLDDKAVDDTLGVVLKHASDHERAIRELRLRRPPDVSSGLVDRHIAFLEALRAAGLPVSLAEDIDAVAALSALPWDRRATIRDAYAATLVKKQSQRPTFDALFDVYFPRLVGEGVHGDAADATSADAPVRDNAPGAGGVPRAAGSRRWWTATRRRWPGSRSRWWAGSGRCPAAVRGCRAGRRTPRCSGWRRPTLVDQIVAALLAEGRTEEEAARVAGRRVGGFTGQVEDDARRRIAEEKGPDHVADVAIRPSIDRIDFTAARKADLEQMRREIYPLARRLATRLTQEHHAKRRGPLDFRRTVRASISTGGVPLTTHHRPKRPHRNELVVLCDVSGSVANFAQFTLLLVFALRDQFQKVRAFTFIDHVHEVTPPLQARGRRRRRDDRPGRQHLAGGAVGTDQLRPVRSPSSSTSTPTRWVPSRRC